MLCLTTLGVVNAESVAYIELFYENKTFIYKDEYIEPSNHLVASEIFDRKINAPLKEKLDFVSERLKGGADYKSAMLTCFPRLCGTVDDAIEQLNCLPEDSEIRFYPDRKPMFYISKERYGIEVNEQKLYMDIYYALMMSPTVKVCIPIKKIEAKVTSSDNIKLTNLRAKYSTDFSYSAQERKHNINLALSKINGASVKNGETFSFNEKVGARTQKNGFKEAKIIQGGKYVPGYGGGVCQVSTTLYNAALMAGLKIEAVNRHSLPCSYELPSFDAMVNSGWSDLKIGNEGDEVFIRAYSSGGRAYVEIYGTVLPYRIERKSEVTYTGKTPPYDEIIDENHEYFDEFAESGSRRILSYSHPEIHSNGYLLYYDLSGTLINKVLIRSDKYFEVRGTVAVAPDN